MKKVEYSLYEEGDHVMVTSGYNKGKVGIVVSHRDAMSNIIYKLAGKEYDEDSSADDWDDDDGYYGDFEDSPVKYLKFITKTQYDTTVKKQKIIEIPGLPVGVKFYGSNLIIGDNVITPTNAKKLADFITDNTKLKKRKK